MSFLFGRRSAGADVEARSFGDDLAGGSFGPGPSFGFGVEATLRSIPAYSAISQIADAFAQIPIHHYSDTPGGVAVRYADPAKLITDPAPGRTPRFIWLQQALASVLTRGNAYGYVLDWDNRMIPSAVTWLDPVGMSVDESGARPDFTYRGQHVDYDRIIHVPGFVLPGRFCGLSPLGLFKMQIENGLKADRFASEWFTSGVAPTGHLKNTAKQLNKVEAQGIKDSFKRAVSGRDIFVSGNDWDWTALTIPAHESQFLEMIKASATQIAAIYRIQPEDIGGETGGSLTYSTLEMNDMKFRRRTIQPWTTRFEQVISAFLPPGESSKFNLDAGIRADLITRMNSHKIGLETGLETLDEARALENKPPLTADEIKAWQLAYGKTPMTQQEGR